MKEISVRTPLEAKELIRIECAGLKGIIHKKLLIDKKLSEFIYQGKTTVNGITLLRKD